MAHSLAGRTALVTGASKGLGRAMAVALAQAGASGSTVGILVNNTGINIRKPITDIVIDGGWTAQ